MSLLTEALEAAADEGALDRSRATTETARDLLAQLEGTVLFAKVANDPRLLDRLWPTSALLLGVPA